jgi:hypothetical protein
MFTRLATGALALLVACSLALAADTPKSGSTVEGTIVKVDAAKKTITVKTDDGTMRVMVSQETKFFGPRRGAVSEGLADERLVPGATLRILMTSNNRWAKEVHIVSVPKAGSARTSEKAETAPESAKPAPAAARVTKPRAPKEEEETPAVPATRGSRMSQYREPAATGDAIRGTIVGVDPASNTITIEVNGRKMDYAVDKSTQFIGPKGGVSHRGIKDDRVVEGAPVSFVVSGKTLKEVHLPYRNQIGK